MKKKSGKPRLEANRNRKPRFEGNRNGKPKFEADRNSKPRFGGKGISKPRLDANRNRKPRFEGNRNGQAKFEANRNSKPKFNGEPKTESEDTDIEMKSDDKSPNPDRIEQREKRKFDFERNSRTIFVGNLPSNLDHKEIAKLFKACGPVECARVRSVIPEKEKLPPKVAQITGRIHPKIDSVNGYVVFEKNENVEATIKKALEMNGKIIDNHHIRVDTAQRPNSKRMTLTSRKKSVFVGNLRFDTRDDDLINHFKKVGPVDYVRLVRDRATGLGKGFGFVKFTDRISVKKAMELDDTDFKGRKLRIKKIDEKMKVPDK